MDVRTIFLAVMLALSSTGTAGAQQGEAQFEQRCARCHEAADPAVPAREWFARLEEIGPLSELDADQLVELTEFLRNHERRTVEMVALAEDKRLFEQKCSLCHTTDRVFLEPLTPESRRHIVLRMQERAADSISPDEAERILEFLNQTQVDVLERLPAYLRDPAATFREKCTACHALERVYLHLEANKEAGPAWLHIIQRMRSKSPEWINEVDAMLILEYLKSVEPARQQEN